MFSFTAFQRPAKPVAKKRLEQSMKPTHLTICGAVFLLMGCATASQKTAMDDNDPPANDDETIVTLPQGGGYTYSAVLNDVGAVTRSDIDPGLRIIDPPLTGTPTFTGTYDMTMITDITGASGNLTGTTRDISGPLTLGIDFGAQTLSTLSGDLDVQGQFTGNVLSGTVSYDGLEGQMLGNVGARQAIAVFTRQEADSIFAGGFYANDTQ